MRGRAYTRHQAARHKARVKHFFWVDPNEPLDPDIVGRWARTPHPCSCYMCGNPRKHFGEKTWQEKKIAARDGDL